MSLLQMSCTGAIMILVILAVRGLFMHKIPKKAFLALWCVALLRLLVPFSLPSPWSAYSLLEQSAPLMDTLQTTAAADLLPMASTGLTVAGPDAAGPSLAHHAVAGSLWLAGALLCGLFFTLTYIRCRREFRTSLPVDNEFITRWLQAHPLRRRVSVRQFSRIAAPLTFGIVHPVILLPKTTDWADTSSLRFVLTHEFIHIRRFDAAAKLLLAAALCIHWFNPLVWVLYVLANRDMELACDEKVVRIFGETIKSAYALALISMEEKKSRRTPLCNNFSKNAIEERIEAIMKTKKTSIVALVGALCLVGGMTTVFATSAVANNEPPQITYVADADYSSSKPTPKEPTQQELLAQYGSFGMSFDTNGKMLFNGELVRYFCDGVEFEPDNWSIRYEYLNKNGTIDVFSKRNSIDNGDGSINPFGALVGLEKTSQDEFNQRDIRDFYGSANAVTDDVGSTSLAGPTFTERFSAYQEYGIEYKERPGSSGAGDVYYNGQLVKTFIDESPNGGVFSYSSKTGGEIIVRTVYNNNGILTGVEKQ